jgi:DNA-binding FadR family transcriptional regulator
MDQYSPILQQLDSDLLRYIIKQNLKPGDRIPALSDLSLVLNISVSKLREQLEVARILGIVEVRPRTGIRCLEYNVMPALRLSLFFALAGDRQMFDLFSNLRIHVEVAYWHEATSRLTREDKLRLRELVEQAWSKLRDEHIIIPHKEHREFHMGIFCRLEHPFVKGILEAYWEAYEAVELNRYADYAYLENVWTYHEQIVEAIEAGDIEGSLAAFVEHTRLLRPRPNSDLMTTEHIGTIKLAE